MITMPNVKIEVPKLQNFMRQRNLIGHHLVLVNETILNL